MEHKQAAELVLKALDGPMGPKVASKVIHTWLCGGVQGIGKQEVDEIVKRWPYGEQIKQMMGQVERLSVLEHLRLMSAGMNPTEQARAMVALKGREMAVVDQIRRYLALTIKDENAKKALGLDGIV